MPLSITTLVENHPGEHKALKSEHGLSFFIEKDGFRMVFDTGQSRTFMENARELTIDLTRLDAVALSHGHYDHSGGFRHLAEMTAGFTLYTGTGFFDPKYGVSGSSGEFLGNNFDEAFLAGKPIRHHSVGEAVTAIAPGMTIHTGFPRIHSDEVINPRFRILENGAFRQDRFDDEIALALESPEGLVVVLGCSHPGMKNMLTAIEERHQMPVYAVIGGTHLVEAGEESLNASMRFLKEKGIRVIGVSHCTGETAVERLAGENPNYSLNRTGSCLFVV